MDHPAHDLDSPAFRALNPFGQIPVIEDDGEELEVVRRSTPFGGVAENGLVFVAFTRDRDRIDRMLRRMVGLDGPRDALTAWSTPISAAYYYVPPAEALIG